MNSNLILYMNECIHYFGEATVIATLDLTSDCWLVKIARDYCDENILFAPLLAIPIHEHVFSLERGFK